MVSFDRLKRGLHSTKGKVALALAGLAAAGTIKYTFFHKKVCHTIETPVCAAYYVHGQDVCDPQGIDYSKTNPLLELLLQEELTVAQEGNFFQLAKKDVKTVTKENGVSANVAATYLATHDIRGLLYHELDLINPAERLEGVIFSESSGKVTVGCNKMHACGPGQLRKDGFNGVLDLLYSNTPKAEKYRAVHPREVHALREMIDQVAGSDNAQFQEYFSLMQRISETLTVHQTQSDQRWNELRDNKNPSAEERAEFEALRLRKNQLYHANRMIREGLLITNAGSQASSAKHYQALKEYGNVNDFFTAEIGMDLKYTLGISWEDYVRSQRNVVESVWERVSTQSGAGELEVKANILCADISLAAEIDRCRGNVACGMKNYQGIITKAGAKYDYTRKVEQVARDNGAINEGLYGDKRLKCNVLGSDQKCEDPKYLKKDE